MGGTRKGLQRSRSNGGNISNWLSAVDGRRGGTGCATGRTECEAVFIIPEDLVRGLAGRPSRARCLLPGKKPIETTVPHRGDTG